MIEAGDNVATNTDAVDTFQLPLVPLEEQIRLAGLSGGSRCSCWLLAAHQRMTQLVELELAADGVEPNGYGMLSRSAARGPVRLTADGRRAAGFPLTTASDVVRRLEAGGHAPRRPNPEDGRSHLFELSGPGDASGSRLAGAAAHRRAARPSASQVRAALAR